MEIKYHINVVVGSPIWPRLWLWRIGNQPAADAALIKGAVESGEEKSEQRRRRVVCVLKEIKHVPESKLGLRKSLLL